jgi:hypothetical protein
MDMDKFCDKAIKEINSELYEDGGMVGAGPGGATSASDVSGAPGVTKADQMDAAAHIDWKSGGGPETNLGKRAMKKKKAIVRRKFPGAYSSLISSTK